MSTGLFAVVLPTGNEVIPAHFDTISVASGAYEPPQRAALRCS